MNLRRAAIAGSISLPIIALLGWGLTRDPGEIRSPLRGREAPDFELAVFAQGQADAARPQGDTIRLSEFRGEVVVLNFWASWCIACRYEHRDLSEVAASYIDKGVKFFGILYDDTPSNGLRWIETMGGQSYPSIDDPRKRTAIDFGLYGVPETFMIGRDGVVAYKHTGPISDELLRFKLDSLLASGAARASP